MKTLFILSLFFVNVFLFAQSKSYSVPDSLLTGELDKNKYKLLLKAAKRARPSEARYLPGKRLLKFAVENNYSNDKVATAYRLISQAKKKSDADSFLYFNQLALSRFDTASAGKIVWPIVAFERAEYYFQTKRLDSMMFYADKALGFESAKKQPVIVSAAMQLKSDYFKSKNQYDSAQYVLIQALNMISEGNENQPVYNKVRAAIHIKLGKLYRTASNFRGYREKLNTSFDLVKDSTSKTIILAHLADSYLARAQYDSAHLYAVRTADFTHDTESRIVSFRKRAETLSGLGEFRSAARMLDSLRKYFALGSDYVQKNVRPAYEGSILIGTGKVEKGKELFRTSFPSGDNFLEEWDADEYLMYLKAMAPHQPAKATTRQLDTLKQLLFVKAQDSTATIIENMRVKYDSEKKEQDNLRLTQQRDFEARRNRTLRYVSIGSVLFATLLGFLLFMLRRRNGQLRASKQRIQILNQDLNHRTSNYLESIVILLQRQLENAAADEKDKTVVKSLERQVLAFTKVQDKLAADLDTVNLKEYLEDFCETIREALSAQGRPVRFDTNIADVGVRPDFAAPLALIINELATNSLKYARREEGTLRIALDAIVETDGELRVFYRDGGRQDGEIDQRVFSSGQGTELILGFTGELKGKLLRYGEESYDYEVVFGLEG